MSRESVLRGNLTVGGALVRALAVLLAETGLSEIEYAVGDRRIRVARNAAVSVALPAAPAPQAGANAGDVAAEPSLAAHPGAVKAPMVGTVSLSPPPQPPPSPNLPDTPRPR